MAHQAQRAVVDDVGAEIQEPAAQLLLQHRLDGAVREPHDIVIHFHVVPVRRAASS